MAGLTRNFLRCARIWSTPFNRTQISLQFKTARILHTGVPYFSARKDLLSCVQLEIDMENVQPLPPFKKFEVKTSGCLASLSRKLKNGNELVIELNANESLMSDNAFDDDADGMETSEDVDENVDGPTFMPVFKVNIKKPTGAALSCQCTFESDDISDEFEPDESFRIQSVMVLPHNYNPKSETQVYSADATLFDKTLSKGLRAYLKEEGLTSDILADVLEFYSSFEHHCYVDGFLKGLKNFVES